MRRVAFIWLIVTIWAAQVTGKPVTQQEIQSVVQSFVLTAFPAGEHYGISEVIPVRNGTDVPVYIVNLKPGGWILLAGDDKASPILGYSTRGSFDAGFPEKDAVDYWMKFYSNSIQSVIKDNKLPRNSLWNGSTGTYKLKSALSTAIEPLIPVEWDQGKAWNYYCPSDQQGPDGHVYVGCVGVCMAQAMSFYHYPLQGTGSRTYFQDPYGTIIVHYDLESPYRWDSMALDAPDKDNARLLFHCAVSVQMNFGSDGSSAQTKNIPSSLSKYFKYYSGVKYVARYADDSTWISLLTSELVAGRPLIYSGFPETSTTGHAFNIDGVDTRGYFHLNWGWNGKYNGYYLINNLRPGTNNFTRDQGAVVNIRPPVYAPTDLNLATVKVREGLPAGTYVSRLKITDEAKDNQYIITVNNDTVNGDSTLSQDFYISNDSLKTSKVFLYNEKKEYPIYIKVQDKFGHSYGEKFTISILEAIPTAIYDNTISGIEVFPNPSTGQVTIRDSNPGLFEVVVTDQLGRQISHLESDGTQQILQFNHPVPGLYIFKITTQNSDPVIRKIIIR